MSNQLQIVYISLLNSRKQQQQQQQQHKRIFVSFLPHFCYFCWCLFSSIELN